MSKGLRMPCIYLSSFKKWHTDMLSTNGGAKDSPKITGLPSHKWKKVRPIIEDFFYIDAGQWHHEQLEDDWIKMETQHERFSKQKCTTLRNLGRRKKRLHKPKSNAHNKNDNNITEFTQTRVRHHPSPSNHKK